MNGNSYCYLCIVNILSVDGLAPIGDRASTDIILISNSPAHIQDRHLKVDKGYRLVYSFNSMNMGHKFIANK